MQPNPKKVRRNEDKDYAEIYQDNFLKNNDPASLGQSAYNRQLSADVKKRIGQGNLESSGQTSVGTTSANQRAGYSSVDNAGAAMDRRAGAMARAQQGEVGLGGGVDMPSLETMGQNFVGSASATQRAGYTQADPITRQRAAEQRAAQGEVGLTNPNMQEPTLGTSQFDAEMGEGFRNPVQRGPGRFGADSELAQGVGTYSGNINNSQSGYSQFDNFQRRDGSLQAVIPGYDKSQYADSIDREIVNPQYGAYNQGLANRVQTREDLLKAQQEALTKQYNTQQGSATQRAGSSPVDYAAMAMRSRTQAEAEAAARAAQAEARAQQIRLGDPSATASAGYSPVNNAGRVLDTRAGLETQRDAREQDVEYNAMNANQRAGYSPVDNSAMEYRKPGYDKSQYADSIDSEIVNPVYGGYNLGLADRAQTRNDLYEARDEALRKQYYAQQGNANQRAGYSQAGDIQRNRIAGSQAQRDAREQQIRNEVGVFPEYVDPNDYNTSRKYGKDAYDKAVKDAQIRADLTNARNAALLNEGNKRPDRTEFENTVDRGVQPEYVDPSDYNLTRKAGVDAYNEALRNAQVQADLTNTKNEQLLSQYNAGGFPTLENVTGGGGTTDSGTTDSGTTDSGTTTGGAQDEALKSSGTTSGGTTGGVEPRTSSPVSGSISSKESNLYATLDAEEEQVLNQFNNNYNQFMQLAINRGAVRGDIESQGFTGGIGQQIRDYLSTGEMQQLNQLMMGRDQALKDIDLRRNDVPTLALKQSAEELQLAMGSMQLKTQFAMDLATAVTSGIYGLDDAQAFADQYGLQNIEDLIISAAQAEIKAGADAETIKGSLTDAGIDPELVDNKIDEPNTFTDVSNNFLVATDNALAIADASEIDNYNEWADEYIAESGTGRDILDWVVGYLGASLAPITGGASLEVFRDSGGLDTVGKEDRTVLATDLVQSKFFQDFGEQLQSEGGLTGRIDYVRDLSTQGAGLGYYNDTYKVTVGGTTYDLEGADITTLVASLTAGNFKVPQALLDLAEEVYNQGLEGGFAKFTDSFGGKYGNAHKLYKEVMKK